MSILHDKKTGLYIAQFTIASLVFHIKAYTRNGAIEKALSALLKNK